MDTNSYMHSLENTVTPLSMGFHFQSDKGGYYNTYVRV